MEWMVPAQLYGLSGINPQKKKNYGYFLFARCVRFTPLQLPSTVCPGSSEPPEKIFNIFASENEVFTIYLHLRYFRSNIIRLQSKIILGHLNSIG